MPYSGHGSASLVAPPAAGLTPAGAETGLPLGLMRMPRTGWWRRGSDWLLMTLPTWPAGQNAVLVGPPRSGKGAAVIVPTLLAAPDQPCPPHLVATDPKGELFATTADWLAAAGYAVRVLVWADAAQSDAYDALSWARSDPEGPVDYARVSELASALVPVNLYERDPFWGQAARLIASVAVVLAVRLDGTLADALALAYAAANDPEALLALAERTDAWAAGQLRVLLSAMAAHPQLRASLVVDLPARYQTWTTPTTLAVVDRPRDGETPLRWTDLTAADAPPTVVYLVGGPAQASQQAYAWAHCLSALLGAQRQQGRLPRPIWLVLDEVANIGRIPGILSALTVLPGSGVSTVLGLQTVTQLQTVYPRAEAEAILGAAHAILALPGLDHASAQWVSDQLGYGTETAWAKGVDGQGRESWTVSHHQRRVLYPDEVQSLAEDRLLVLRLGYRGTVLRQHRYYAVPAWAGPAAIGDPRNPHIAEALAAHRREPLRTPDLTARTAALAQQAAGGSGAPAPAPADRDVVATPLDLAALLRDDA